MQKEMGAEGKNSLVDDESILYGNTVDVYGNVLFF